MHKHEHKVDLDGASEEDLKKKHEKEEKDKKDHHHHDDANTYLILGDHHSFYKI